MEETNNTPTKWWHHLVIVIVLIGITTVAFISLKGAFGDISKSNWAMVKTIQQSNVELVQGHSTDSLSGAQLAIINKKIGILEQQKDQYLSLLKILYKNYYAMLTLFPYLSGIAAIIAFFLMQNGWKSSSAYLKTLFVVTTFLASLVGIFPEVYEQEANIKRYTNAYIQYAKIQKDLYNYSLTAPRIGDQIIYFDEFLRKINQREKTLIDLHLGLQKKEITSNVFDLKK